MTQCCCPDDLDNPRRYSASCFCEKCMSGNNDGLSRAIDGSVATQTWYIDLGEATGNATHPICADSSLELKNNRVPLLARQGDGFRGYEMSPGLFYDIYGHGQGCNCNWVSTHVGGFYGAPIHYTDNSMAGQQPGVIRAGGSCWQRSMKITLEVEELCLKREEGNVGYLKRGFEEDMRCVRNHLGVTPDSHIGGTAPDYIATGNPCSPCYNNSGNVYGSIDNGSNPFEVDCNYLTVDRSEAYVDTSPLCHPGNGLSVGNNNTVQGDFDKCDDLVDNIGGKYFWITDDIGEKYHVWFRREGQDIDPSPSGSAGGILIDIGGYGADPAIPHLEQKLQFGADGLNQCNELLYLIWEELSSQFYDFPDPTPGSILDHNLRKWAVVYPPMAVSCATSKSLPESACTLCVRASKTYRVNGNQPARLYDGNTGLEFGDAGPPEIIGGWGHCCAGPAPRLFIEVPTLKESVPQAVFDPNTNEWSEVETPIGGTGVSDCDPNDPLCVCLDAVGGQGFPGGPPIITDHGTNDHALYEYGLSGDFECFDCNTFTLRNITQGSNSDTSHLSLPNEVTVCPEEPCINKIGFLIVLDNDPLYGTPDDCYAQSWNTGQCMFNVDAENLRRHLEQNPDLDVRVVVVTPKGDENLAVPQCSNNFSDTNFPNDFMGGVQAQINSDPRCCWGMSGSEIFAKNWGSVTYPTQRTGNCMGASGSCGAGCSGFPMEWGGQCSGCGIPTDQTSITGGGSLGNLPISITSVDNCPQIDKDPDLYGWNQDYCCYPASIRSTLYCGPPYPDPGGFRYTGGCDPSSPQQCAPGGLACNCCCSPSLERNLCGNVFPKEPQRRGGVFEATCDRVTDQDILGAWNTLTSNGSWIPEEFHFWHGPDLKGGVNPDCMDGDMGVYYENSQQMACSTGGSSPEPNWDRYGGWVKSTGCGYSSLHGVTFRPTMWADAYVQILDDIYALPDVTDLGMYFQPTQMTTRPGIVSYSRGWLNNVARALPSCKSMDRTEGDPTTYINDYDWGCAPRVQWGTATLRKYNVEVPHDQNTNAIPNDPNTFFDCPAAVGSPCWIEVWAATARPPYGGYWQYVGIKKSEAGCDMGTPNQNLRGTGNLCPDSLREFCQYRKAPDRCCDRQGRPISARFVSGGNWIPQSLDPCSGGQPATRGSWSWEYPDYKITNHPINQAWKKYGLASDPFWTRDPRSGYRKKYCDCCPCPEPKGDLTFTIPNTNTCWGINQDGQKTEDPLPLGGNFTLKPIADSCAWAAEFNNSFITEAKFIKGRNSEGVSIDGTFDRVFGWNNYQLHLYHRNEMIAIYNLEIDDLGNTWPCSGSLTLNRQNYTMISSFTNIEYILSGDNEHHGDAHVCDPCSWQGEDNAFAELRLETVIFDGTTNIPRQQELLEKIHNASITLTSTDGTTKTYTLKTDGSANASNLEFNWELPDSGSWSFIASGGTIQNLADLIASPSGHDGKIVLEYPIPGMQNHYARHNVFRFIQAETGVAGNTNIIYNDEFKEWCKLTNPRVSYQVAPVCPDKFIGGEYCESYHGVPVSTQVWGQPPDTPFYGGVLGGGVKCYDRHPSSWPHSCPCTDPVVRCLPDTITVTI